MTLAWQFGGALMRDGREFPADGAKLVYGGPLVMCESGLHASERILDALKYAPGNWIFHVECGGGIKHDTDKLVCSERTILWRIDGERVLREFARWAALQVIDLWAAPDVVRRYLETGDETIRTAARAAARDARNTWAARAAASAAREAARDAWAASTARAAASAAAWAGVRAAASEAACAVASAAASEAARAAALTGASAAQNAQLAAMVEAARASEQP